MKYIPRFLAIFCVLVVFFIFCTTTIILYKTVTDYNFYKSFQESTDYNYIYKTILWFIFTGWFCFFSIKNSKELWNDL